MDVAAYLPCPTCKHDPLAEVVSTLVWMAVAGAGPEPTPDRMVSFVFADGARRTIPVPEGSAYETWPVDVHHAVRGYLERHREDLALVALQNDGNHTAAREIRRAREGARIATMGVDLKRKIAEHAAKTTTRLDSLSPAG